MDELKHLTNKNNIQQITVGLQKLLKTIRSERAQGSKDNQIKEIDYLRELCSSEFTNLNLLAHQAFVRLVEDGTIDGATCLSMFMTMLPNAKYNQYTALTEGVVDLLLLDLKRRSVLMEPTKAYTCPFGLKAPQHPIITLIQKSESNLNDLTNKIRGICNHHDKEIRQHSIEFLRPVFLYTLCNVIIVPDSMAIWTCLLSQMNKSNKAKELVYEILSYRKTDSATATLMTSVLLSDAVVASDSIDTTIQFSLHLTAVLNDLSSYGYDPRPGFRIIRQTISEMKQVDRLISDLFIILLNQSLHDVSPVYLPDVVRLLKLIIKSKGGGNHVTRAMVLDGLIAWIANFSLVPADGLHSIKELIDFIINFDNLDSLPQLKSTKDSCDVKFSHPSLAIGFQLARLSQRIEENLLEGKTNNLNEFIDSVKEPSRTRFCHQIHLFLRGIFLHGKAPPEQCNNIFKILLKLVQENQDVATGLLLPVLFKLSREKEPIVQLELLRGLTQFAVIKENIPTILNTLNSVSSGALRPLSLDLYLRLWKQENRTYPFLHKLLHNPNEKNKSSHELTIAKAFAIKEICEIKPTQHGTDLVVHLSNILNQSSGSAGETSTTLAIEAINFLCMSHTINIASTWKALKQKFDKEKRKRPIMALCKFFGHVPLLRSPTEEYEQLYTESISKLWHYVVNSDCIEIISSALMALKHFDYCGFVLSQIPEIFRQDLVIPSGYTKTADEKLNPVDVLDYVPGQCWVQLIQKVNPSARQFASDLVSHYIHNEIESYRRDVYYLPEGKPEPNNLRRLHNRSPLRYIVQYLVMNAKKSIEGDEDIVLNCLRCLSKKFPKPIPPLDMYFLIHFMNDNNDNIKIKRHCIRILSNQLIQSGTAKNLLENYVTKFTEEQVNDFEEIEIVLGVLVELVNGLSTDISEKFMKHLFDFSFRNYKFKSIVFESLLESLKPIFTESCRNEDALQMVAGLMESYFHLIEPNDKVFQKFMEVCENVPSARLDPMISPKTWNDVSSKKFRKATLVRCHLAATSRRLDNSLFWLNPIVDNISKFVSDQPFVLQQIALLLHRYGNDKNFSNWTMEVQSRVQAALLEKNVKNETTEFLMDLFMLCIVVSSGCSALVGNVEVLASCRQSRLDGFPAALHILSEQAFWRDCSVRVDDVKMIDRYNSKNPSIGTLYLTATHLIFVDPDINKETWIMLTHIGSIDKLPLSTSGSPLLIRCKNFLSVNFVISKERECHDVYTTLLKLCQPVHIRNLYCFQYTSSNEDLIKSAGWEFFKLENEYKRMRVPNDKWTLCSLNQNYELCDTYPRQIYVPSEASTAMLMGSSRFRSKGRLPALTYLHPNKASICRCSQPLSGFSARCLEDEQMLEAIRNTNPNSEFMYVVDTRPRINAIANRAAGKGYENEAFYENIKFQFLGIENIHVMRTSLQKLVETCEQKSLTMSGFLGSLESSGWLKHIRSILDTSHFIANAIDKGVSVVVHCSDGWDRTSQVCAVAALMLDPFYRTIKGFQGLIEKDWLAFGHKFSDRCGYIHSDPKEQSPVFTQFLDCTFQMMQQRVDAFEFNEGFLLTLHDHVQSCQFGTFIGNCEKDRLDLRLSESTFSLWGYMANHLNEYINPLYRPEMDEIIRPNLAPQSIKFWRGMYGRFETGVHPREPLDALLLSSRDHCTSLEDHMQHLTKRITSFKNLISKSAKKLQNVSRPKELVEINDNKYNYDRKMSELYSADDDHPLKATDFSFSNLSVTEDSAEKINSELQSVAVDWKPLRSSASCACSTPFDQIVRKNHCWRCGEVFCARCIDRSIALPGHASGKAVPVCRTCYRIVHQTSP